MNSVPDSILDRISKLHALSERAGTEAEAILAATRMRELLDAYNLELGEVEIRREGPDERDVLSRRTKDDATEILLSVVSELCGVGMYWLLTKPDPKTRRRDSIARFYGSRANVQAALATYAYFEASIETLYQAHRKTAPLGFLFAIQKLSRPEYRTGCALRLSLRIRQWIKERNQSADAQALILVTDELKAQREQELREGGLAERENKISTVRRSASFAQGWGDGERVDIQGAGKQIGEPS